MTQEYLLVLLCNQRHSFHHEILHQNVVVKLTHNQNERKAEKDWIAEMPIIAVNTSYKVSRYCQTVQLKLSNEQAFKKFVALGQKG